MSEIVHSVNIMISILLGGTSYMIYYILRMAHLEMRDERQDVTRFES